jgi:DNA-binding CsgD family transcriptional regulator
MADIRRIVDLYELYGSYKKVARELSISLNTTKKYLRRVK